MVKLMLQPIQSAQNSKFKELLRLVHDNQRLKQQHLAVMEGLHGLQAVLDHLALQGSNATVAMLQLVVPDGMVQHSEWPHVQSALQRVVQHQHSVCNHSSASAPVTLWQVPGALYNKLSLQSTPTGPLLLLRVLPSPVPLNPEEDVLVLDGLQDPGNVGTLVRTAAAAGVRQLVCSQDSAWVWSDKALRAGMGAQLAMRLFQEENLLHSLVQNPRPVRVTSLGPHPSLASVFAANLCQPGVWVFGHEGQGVRPIWQQRATQYIHIPQSPWVESLNVAASAAVCLYEQWRQRQG
jgi:TrmH family RNA methyltransferase